MSEAAPRAAPAGENVTCSRCGAVMERSDRFCRSCGLEVRADAAAIDNYLAEILPGRIDAALEKRVKDQKIVEVETAELLADRAIKWLRTLGFFLGIPAAAIVAVVSFLGLRTYSDIEKTYAAIQRVTDRAAELEKQLIGPQQQLTKVNTELADLQKELQTAKATLTSQISQVGARQTNVEDQLKAIKGRLDFSPSSNLAPALREKLENGLARFIVYLQDINFQGLDDRVSVRVFSKEEPLSGAFAAQSEVINAFYADKVLYIHRAMADNLSVALIEYMHFALKTLPGGQPLADSDLFYGLSDYFAASFLGSPLIGDKLGGLFGLPTSFIRNLDNSLSYPAVPNESHHRGEVWGGALWSCRQASDREAVDRAASAAWQTASREATIGEIDQRFGTALSSSSGHAGECLAREIARRALPHSS